MLHLTPANLFVVQSCPLIAHFYIAPTMANLPSLSNHYHHLYISLLAHHCGCSCDCSCRLQTSLRSHLQAVNLSCLILQLHELHCSCSSSCKFEKCIAIAFVKVCKLHHNHTCNAWWFFAVALLADHGQVSGVYCLGSIIWCSHRKFVVALNGRDWGDRHGFVWCHVSADTTIHQNYKINYSNVHFNN